MTPRDDNTLQPSLVTLFSEMQALMGLLPAKATPLAQSAAPSAKAQEVARQQDDMIEAGFDNMPV